MRLVGGDEQRQAGGLAACAHPGRLGVDARCASRVGRTKMRFAPSAAACEIGVLLITPPSTSEWPPIGTGGSTPGIDAAAVMTSSVGPRDRRTSQFSVRSKATT